MKKFLTFFTAFTILTYLFPPAFAAQVDIEVDCLCLDSSYEVYGDEQPSNAVKTTDSDGNATCRMRVRSDSITDHTEKYHAFMDEKIFAPMIAKISKIQTSEDMLKLLGQLEEKKGTCDSENPLPNCVAERALCSYEKYSRVLFQQSGQPALNNVDITSPNDQDVQTIMTSIQNRDQALFQEAVNSEQALDTAMAVYSQFFETYRLHLRFKEVIAALVKVRNVTSFLRQLVGCIPNKFVGVATTKCN